MDTKYENGKIYSIRSPQTNEIYIGSTYQILSKRLAQHNYNYTQYLLGKFNYITSFKLLEYNDHYIELIEEHPCDNKMQLNKREGEIMRQTENCVNRFIAGRTDKEYRFENQEIIREKKKTYREINKDKIKEHKSQPYLCECGRTVQLDHKSRHFKSKFHQTISIV